MVELLLLKVLSIMERIVLLGIRSSTNDLARVIDLIVVMIVLVWL
jgi:hypothetical protein